MNSASIDLNPYRSPSETPPSTSGDQPICFTGSMTKAEGRQVDHLLRGQKTNPYSPQQLFGIGACALLVLGTISIENLGGMGMEGLPHVVVGLVVVALTLTAAAVRYQRSEAILTKLKAEEKGVFTPQAGHIHPQGIDFVTGDFPIQYRWDDFIGCRIDDAALVMYLDYPSNVNFLAASLFENEADWAAARTIVRSNLPLLRYFPRVSGRRPSPVTQHLEAGIKWLDERQWQRALSEFDRVLELRPGETQALQGRMAAAVGLQDLELALDAIEQVLALGEPSATTRRLRATTMIAAQRFEDALVDLDWLLAQTTEGSAELLRDREFVLLQLNKRNEATECTPTAIDVTS